MNHGRNSNKESGTNEDEVDKDRYEKAIELLKQGLTEIPDLRKLPPGSQQFKLWFGEVCNILDLKFGKNSREYDNFARATGALAKTDSIDARLLAQFL